MADRRKSTVLPGKINNTPQLTPEQVAEFKEVRPNL